MNENAKTLYEDMIAEGGDPDANYVVAESLNEDDNIIIYKVLKRGDLKACVEFTCNIVDSGESGGLNIIKMEDFEEHIIKKEELH